MRMTPSEIRALRGGLGRAEFAEALGVTPLTVYRWELPPGSPELRRPRGKVLARLRAWAASRPAVGAADLAASPQDCGSDSHAGGEGGPAPAGMTEGASTDLAPEEEAALLPALAAIDQCRLEQAESELVGLLGSGVLRTDAARALARISLAKLHLLLRHDGKAAFATLVGIGGALPRAVHLQLHVVSAMLHAAVDARLFNPGKTNHHAALAEPLLTEADEEERFLLWYAQFVAAAATFEAAMVSRLVERAARMCELPTTPLGRCLAREAMVAVSLGFTHVAETARRADEYLRIAETGPLPLHRMRALCWRAEVLLEEAAPPERILRMLEEAERLQRRHRIVDGVHSMVLHRNKGEVLMRLGRLAEAEGALLEATRIGSELGYTPFRIYIVLARLHWQAGDVDETRALAERLLRFEGLHQDLSRTFAGIVLLLCDVVQGAPPSDWFDRLEEELASMRHVSAWSIAYRYVVTYALGVCSTHATPEQAGRTLHLAERALEWSPSPTASALFRRYRGNVLARQGRFVEARQSLEAALATFELSGNVPESLLVRRTLANLDLLEERPEAGSRMDATAAQLAKAGVAPPPLLQAEAAPAAACAHSHFPIEQLLVPLQRLSTRGLGAPILQKELLNVAAELVPNRALRLEEVGSNGDAILVGSRRRDVDAWFDFSDGVGRRLRLGVGGELDESQRAAITLLVSFAALAFEVAGLRGFTAAPRPDAPAEDASLPGFVAASESMRRLKAELKRLSGSRATIIITGESGTGKEVVARAIHDLSQRAARPYVTFNSAAIPRELFEGQLFGYRKGAFTGATSDNPGVIRAAEGGTLFLDEIGELPLDVQPKLLRFLENAEVFPLGERSPVRVDVRVIAATHRDLLQLVREGKFREDLYYRLQVIPVHLPPLRERREDVVALARHFIARLTPEGRESPALGRDGELALVAHPWPGNVRELRNVIERALAFDPLPKIIGAEHLRR